MLTFSLKASIKHKEVQLVIPSFVVFTIYRNCPEMWCLMSGCTCVRKKEKVCICKHFTSFLNTWNWVFSFYVVWLIFPVSRVNEMRVCDSSSIALGLSYNSILFKETSCKGIVLCGLYPLKVKCMYTVKGSFIADLNVLILLHYISCEIGFLKACFQAVSEPKIS